MYGLFPDSPSHHLNGFFATHLVVRADSTVFQVNGMSVKERILIEPFAVTVHALQRAKTTGLLDFASTVVVQGCGPIGLMMIATLGAAGVAIAMLRHLKAIGVPVEDLVTHEFPLARITEAFEANIALEGIKIAVVPGA